MHVVIYYPFNDARGTALCADVAREWELRNARKLTRKHLLFTAATHRSTEAALWLDTLGANDVVYVLGHCDAGSSTLQSDDHTTDITAAEVAGRLANDGLKRTFDGAIKVFACSSAAPWKVSVHFKSWMYESFTQQFANEMAKLGFRHCRFFGYTAPVDPVKTPNSTRKIADTGMIWSHYVNASSTRQQVYPNVLTDIRVV